MKIVYISSSSIPSRTANSIQVIKMCQAFAKNNNKVILIIPHQRNEDINSTDIFNFYGVENCFKINKIKVFNIPGKRLIFSLLAAIYSYRNKTDILYSRNIEACFFSTFFSIKTALELHQPLNNKKLYRYMFKRLTKNSNLNRIFTITHSLKNYYLKNYNIRNDKIIVSPDGANPIPPYIKPIKINASKEYNIKIGYIGHLYEGRGIELIYELAKKIPSALFLIIGGKDCDIIKCKDKASNIDNIKFFGFIPPNETDQYRLACDILLAPYSTRVITNAGANTTDWMSPLKLFEYMSAKKAIISSRLPAICEILSNMENALLCDPNNLSEWVFAVQLLIKNKELRNKLSKNAYEDFLNHYTWINRAKNILAHI